MPALEDQEQIMKVMKSGPSVGGGAGHSRSHLAGAPDQPGALNCESQGYDKTK
jgi:hypothetical protein